MQRQLDDVPKEASKESNLTETFTTAYKNICESLKLHFGPRFRKA
jgi:hypothetical protein